jgi:hypothetical protein
MAICKMIKHFISMLLFPYAIFLGCIVNSKDEQVRTKKCQNPHKKKPRRVSYKPNQHIRNRSVSDTAIIPPRKPGLKRRKSDSEIYTFQTRLKLDKITL